MVLRKRLLTIPYIDSVLQSPQILPKKNGKTCVSRCVSQKTRMVGHQFFWKKCGWRLPENIDPPDF